MITIGDNSSSTRGHTTVSTLALLADSAISSPCRSTRLVSGLIFTVSNLGDTSDGGFCACSGVWSGTGTVDGKELSTLAISTGIGVIGGVHVGTTVGLGISDSPGQCGSAGAGSQILGANFT